MGLWYINVTVSPLIILGIEPFLVMRCSSRKSTFLRSRLCEAENEIQLFQLNYLKQFYTIYNFRMHL